MKKFILLAIVLLFVATRSSWAASGGRNLTRDRIYTPPEQIGLGYPRLQAVVGNYVYQVIKSEDRLRFVTFEISQPVAPLFSHGESLSSMKSALDITAWQTDTIYLLCERKDVKFGNKRMIIVLDLSKNPGAPDPVTWIAVPDDSKAMALNRKWMCVVGDSFVRVYDASNKRKLELSYSIDKQNGIQDVVMKGKYLYLLKAGNIITYELSNRKLDKIGSVEVGPYAKELLLVADFSGGYVMAIGSDVPRVYERYPYDPRPQLETKTYCEAFAIDDYGKLERVAAPFVPDRELLLLSATADNDRSSLYFLVWKFSRNTEGGGYFKTPVIRVYRAQGLSWQMIQEINSSVDRPALLLQRGDDFFVYGYGSDDSPLIEGFKVH